MKQLVQVEPVLQAVQVVALGLFRQALRKLAVLEEELDYFCG